MSSNPQATPPVASAKTVATLLFIDTVLIVIFAIIGVASHDGALNVPNIARVAIPFLVPYLVLAVAIKPKHLVHNIIPAGIALWLTTVILGPVLRAVLFDDTSAMAFVLVTAGVLGAFLLGRRSISTLVSRKQNTA